MPSNLPPGVTSRMIDEAAGVDTECLVCGKFYDDCICPECPQCHEFGNPDCYTNHGLIRSEAQKASLAEAEAHWRRQIEEDNRIQDALQADWEAYCKDHDI